MRSDSDEEHRLAKQYRMGLAVGLSLGITALRHKALAVAVIVFNSAPNDVSTRNCKSLLGIRIVQRRPLISCVETIKYLQYNPS